MSISTLLEAARFVEMQEQQKRLEAEYRAAVDAALSASQQPGRAATPAQPTPPPVVCSPDSTAPRSLTSPSPHRPGKHHHTHQHQQVIVSSGRPESAGASTSASQSPVSSAGPGGPFQRALLTPSPVSSAMLPSVQTVAGEKMAVVTAAAASTVSPKMMLVKTSVPSTTTSPGPSMERQQQPQQHQLQPEQQPQVSSTVNVSHGRVIHNSFDMMNPLVIDEANPEAKRRQPPLVFRAGTREVHNKLEKHRRAHLKECFDLLKRQLPHSPDEKKTSNLSILHSALRHIQSIRRTERDLEHQMERLARNKISLQQNLAALKKDWNISCTCENMDLSKFLNQPQHQHHEVGSSAGGHDRPDTIIIRDSSSAVKEEMMDIKMEPLEHGPAAGHPQQNGTDRLAGVPMLATSASGKAQVTTVPNGQQVATIKEVSQQPVQTALSVLPVGYPVSQGLVLQKLIVPKGLTDITPLVQTHFITTPQQLNGKVVPIVNAQYVVKPVVVVSTASPRPS